MPSRIIKESICTSDNLDRLTWFEEAMFYRLIVNCDDYGRMDARAPILRARCFPLKSVTDAQIDKALQSLRSAAMIDLYEVDGRTYLQMRTWEKHQTVRAKRSRYPAPECGDRANKAETPGTSLPPSAGDCTHLHADAGTCMQMQADASTCKQMHADAHGIQSESVSESESESRGKRTRFRPPALEECEAFFTEHKSSIAQGNRFWNYYQANGWRVGKNTMRDWQAAARGWISREGEYKAPQPAGDALLRHTPEERRRTYSAAVIDFDTEDGS